MFTTQIFYIIVDGKGDKSRVEIDVPYATPAAAALAAVPYIANLIQDMVTGGLVGAGVTMSVDLSGDWGPIATLASDVQEKVEFAFRTANGFLKRLNLPTIDESLFLPGTNDLDTSDASVAAFITIMEDGFTVSSTHVDVTDARGEDIEYLASATGNWGKRRK